MTDEITLMQAQKGDTQAFERLVTPYEDMVWRVCWHYMEHHEDAQDAAQEVMLRAWRSIGAFRGGCSVETWLYRICVTVCMDALRKRRLRTGPSMEALQAAGYDPADGSPTPEETVQAEEFHGELRDALRGLPEDMRTALLLSAVEGRSYEEIVQITGAPLGTVKSRIGRAREKLAKMLSQREQFRPSCVQQSERRAEK